MSETQDLANRVTLRKGHVLGDQTTTTAVKFLDLSPLFEPNEEAIWVRLVCTKDMYALFVEDATPAVAPAITDVTGDGAMDFFPAKSPEPVEVEIANPWLAYSSDAAILRVRRSAPPHPARG